jgi:hypothetical protein
MQSPPWLPAVVWTDYRLAVLFVVVAPLALLIWAFVQKNETVQHLMVIYWRVASLLLITVYLFVGAMPYGFLAGWFARLLIPICLWFWIDLNEEIVEQRPTSLKTTFTAWRWAVSAYCVVGAIAQVPTLQCALLESKAMIDQPFCRVWLDAPWMFREFFNPNVKPYTLGFLASLGLGFYVLCLSYFLFFRLGKQGRSATGR